jgi:hypothetical protein
VEGFGNKNQSIDQNNVLCGFLRSPRDFKVKIFRVKKKKKERKKERKKKKKKKKKKKRIKTHLLN